MQAAFQKEFENPYQWLFLDLNSYFANVEQQERPALRGRAVAVVPLMNDSTCAIAASQEAKMYGVRTGTKIYDARRLCPHLVCVLASHDKYVAYHHRILSEVAKHTPINKICSIDELSSKLPPNKQTKAAAIAVAERIKQGIRRNIGSLITCSVGIAPNAFLAKVATDMQKPDGLVVLDHETWPSRLFDLRLTDLPGINMRMELRLMKCGIHSVEQFWNLSPKHARAVWGSVEGERFWYRLHGHDLPEQPTHRSMIGHSRILDPELRTPDMAKLVMRRLTIKAASRLRRMDLYASSLDLSVRDCNDQRFAAGLTCCAAQDNFTFLDMTDHLWDRMMQEITPYRLKKVSVSLSGLCERQEITPDLFDLPAQEKNGPENHGNQTALSDLMDRINRRFGADSISLGPLPKTSAGHVGTKIAFNRIPDIEEFYE